MRPTKYLMHFSAIDGQVFVKTLTGKTLTFDIKKNDMIGSLKEKMKAITGIQEVEEIPIEHLILNFKGTLFFSFDCILMLEFYYFQQKIPMILMNFNHLVGPGRFISKPWPGRPSQLVLMQVIRLRLSKQESRTKKESHLISSDSFLLVLWLFVILLIYF